MRNEAHTHREIMVKPVGYVLKTIEKIRRMLDSEKKMKKKSRKRESDLVLKISEMRQKDEKKRKIFSEIEMK